jgi:RimJ/RimL family protein N-acetyltransferase
MTTIVETDRLLLREFVPDDLEAFCRLVSDPDVTRFTGDGGKSRDEVKQGLEERVFADYRKYGYGRWATVLKATGRVIGFAGLKYLDEVDAVDLGYRFFKEYWGRGLATEASAAVLRHGFESLGLERVIGITDVENQASIRVLEKLGFAYQDTRTHRGHQVAWYVLHRAT